MQGDLVEILMRVLKMGLNKAEPSVVLPWPHQQRPSLLPTASF